MAQMVGLHPGWWVTFQNPVRWNIPSAILYLAIPFLVMLTMPHKAGSVKGAILLPTPCEQTLLHSADRLRIAGPITWHLGVGGPQSLAWRQARYDAVAQESP